MLAAILLAAIELAEVFSAGGDAWNRPIGEYTHVTMRGATTYHGVDIVEARFVENAGTIQRVEMILYNRGDDPAVIRESDLADLLARADGAIDIAKARKTKIKSGAFKYEWSDLRRNPPLEAVWGIENGIVQYVRLSILRPGGGKQASGGKPAKGRVSANVRRNADGDVWIDGVPMVDQGAKGYCAVATCERVLRYFGYNVDEHELAQMAGTTADGGTSIREMRETVRRMGSKCRLGYNEIVSMFGSRKDAEKELEAYNKSAKAMKRPELDGSRFVVDRVFRMQLMIEAMEPEVLLRERSRDARFKKFSAGIKSRIDAGIPVFWSVKLGIFPEPDIPQADGGHMRLIIGYNAKTHEIIYSDSWGKGHELKRMPEDRAFAITHDAFSLRPL